MSSPINIPHCTELPHFGHGAIVCASTISILVSPNDGSGPHRGTMALGALRAILILCPGLDQGRRNVSMFLPGGRQAQLIDNGQVASSRRVVGRVRFGLVGTSDIPERYCEPPALLRRFGGARNHPLKWCLPQRSMGACSSHRRPFFFGLGAKCSRRRFARVCPTDTTRRIGRGAPRKLARKPRAASDNIARRAQKSA